MENKINIAELLRDCPKGMELDCTTWENVTFEEVRNDTIIIVRNNKQPYVDTVALNKYGRVTSYEDEKCRIFPKGKTTWEGFHRPFVEGDVIYVDDFIAILSNITESGVVWYHCYYCTNPKIFRAQRDFGLGNIKDGEFRFATEEEKQKLFDAIKENGYHWNAETKTLEKWTIQNAKAGDVISYGNGWTCIFKGIYERWYSSYCFITIDGEFHTGYENHEVSTTINGNVHLATKEQCDRLFQKMKEAGYEWNPETKTLEKLVESKEDDKAVIAGICFNREDYADEVELNLGDYEIKTCKDRTYAVLKNAETKTSQNLFPYGIGTKVWVKSDKERKYIHTIVGISRNSFGNLEYEVKEEKTGTVVHYPKDLLIPATTNELKFKTGDRIRHKSSGLHCTLEKYAEGISAYYTNIGLALTPKDLEQWELAPNKFDFNTLKPFTKVLVRCSNNGIWNPQFFSRFRPKSKFPFECTYNSWIQCVPYEGNEYLWNTTNKCDEFYKIWEDE